MLRHPSIIGWSVPFVSLWLRSCARHKPISLKISRVDSSTWNTLFFDSRALLNRLETTLFNLACLPIVSRNTQYQEIKWRSSISPRCRNLRISSKPKAKSRIAFNFCCSIIFFFLFLLLFFFDAIQRRKIWIIDWILKYHFFFAILIRDNNKITL